MNRRNFFGTLLAASAGFAILPGAGRIWKALDARCIPNPDYNKASLEIWFMCPKEEWNAWNRLLTTKTWPAGMGETRRIIA